MGGEHADASTPDAVVTVAETSRDIGEQVALARTRERLLGLGSPTVLGRYPIEERLGQGGMGIVYAARDPDLDRRVALKVLHARLSRDSQGKVRMVREAQALAKLSHPNVVHVYEVGRHAGQVYVVMEFVEGQTLRAWQKSAPRPWIDVVRMYAMAARGLEAAHRAGIVHRDFKPDNVLVGSDGRARVMDFGLARPSFDASVLQSTDGEPASSTGPGHELGSADSVTLTGTIMGTPAYMDPSQLAGVTADAQSDQYAFCVALFEALYGRRPYQGSSVTELADRMARERPAHVVPQRHGVPRSLHAVLMKGLYHERAERHASMTALVEALERIVEGRAGWRRAVPWILGPTAVAVAASIWAMRPSPAPTVASPTSMASTVDPWATVVSKTDLPTPIPEPLPHDPARVTVHRLRNGLTVYVAPRADEPRVVTRVVIRAGAPDDGVGTPGLARLTLAATKPGTSRLGVADPQAERPFLQRQYDALGQVAKAETEAQRQFWGHVADLAFRESAPFLSPRDILAVGRATGAGDGFENVMLGTVLETRVPTPRYEAWLQMTAEMLRNPTFRGLPSIATYWTENERWSDEHGGVGLAMATALSEAFGTGHDPRGELAFASRLPLEEIRAFHRRYYRPNNVAIVMVGDISPERAVAAAEEAFGDWEPAPIPETSVLRDEPWPGERKVVHAPSRGGDEVWVGWSLPPATERAPEAFEVLEALLRGPEGLQRQVLAHEDSLSAWGAMLAPRGLVMMGIESRNGVETQAEAALMRPIQAIARGEFSDADWDRALAEYQLRRSRWSRSAENLAGLLSETYLHHRAWTDVAATLGSDATHAPRREDVEDAARCLLQERGHAVVIGEPGSESSDFTPLTYAPAPPVAASEAPGPWARALADSSSTEVEPRFLSEGRNFIRRVQGHRRYIGAKVEGPLFEVTFDFPRGVRQDPFVCDSVRAWEGAWRNAGPPMHGAEVWVECDVERTRIHVEGLANRFDGLMEGIAARLADPTIATDRAPFGEDVKWRASLRENYDDVADALLHRAVLGPEGLEGLLPSDEQMLAAVPGQVDASLVALAATAPDVWYVGPDPEHAAESLPVPPPPSAAPATTAPAPAPARRSAIYVVDAPGVEQVDVRVAVVIPEPSPKDAVLVDLFRQTFGPGFAATDVAGLSFEAAAYQSLLPTRRTFHAWGYLAEHHEVCALLAAIETDFERPPERAAVEHARASLESLYRGQRVNAFDIPRFVHSWRSEDALDPRVERWMALGSADFEALRAFARDVAELPRIVTITADLSRLDVAALREFAPVIRLRPEDVVRNVAKVRPTAG